MFRPIPSKKSISAHILLMTKKNKFIAEPPDEEDIIFTGLVAQLIWV